MKKYLSRLGIAAATIAVIIGGAAAFSAFEAHVVNVTATINNATDISTDSFTYGNVFPQEILHNPVTLSLSSSFLSGSNTQADSLDYVLKQKPKCQINSVQQEVVAQDLPEFAQVVDVPGVDQGPVTFACPDGYHKMPLLCPYLSKTSPTAGDTSVPSFHGTTTLEAWTDATSVATEATGHLSKSGATSTTWDIDLHTPCFKGECAQDWASFVTTANPAVTDPASFEADPANKGQAMGCDLWYEVSGIGTTTGPTIVTVRAGDLDPNGTNGTSTPAVVATDGQNKWFFYNDTTDVVDNSLGSFVPGPGTPPHGTGSAQITLSAPPGDRRNIGTYQFDSTLLGSITQMSFGAYSHSGVAGATESPYLVFDVDFATSTITGYQNRLVYVPSQNGPVPQDTWNTFDAINSGNALWTWSGLAKGPDKIASTADDNTWPDGNTSVYRTWSSIMAAFPNAKVLSLGGQLGVRVGEPGPTGYTGNIDFFSIGTSGTPTVYDFEN